MLKVLLATFFWLFLILIGCLCPLLATFMGYKLKPDVGRYYV